MSAIFEGKNINSTRILFLSDNLTDVAFELLDFKLKPELFEQIWQGAIESYKTSPMKDIYLMM